MIKFTYVDGERNVEHTIRHGETTLTEVCEAFMDFLRGCGYGIEVGAYISIESDEEEHECCGKCKQSDNGIVCPDCGCDTCECDDGRYEIVGEGMCAKTVVREGGC